MSLELRVGGAMRFAFAPDFALDGVVTELEPPRVFAFLWGEDLLCVELVPDGPGTRLTLLHVLDTEGESAAAKTAAGWHVCLDGLARRLAGEDGVPASTGATPEWRERYDAYRRGNAVGRSRAGLEEAGAGRGAT